MELVALKSFRPQNQKGKSIALGQTFSADDQYGKELVRLGLAVEGGSKEQQEYKQKMKEDYENKGMPTTPETPEERSQGLTQPGGEYKTVQQRNEEQQKHDKSSGKK